MGQEGGGGRRGRPPLNEETGAGVRGPGVGGAGMPWVSHCLHAWDERAGRGFAPSVCEVVCVGCPSLTVCDGCMEPVGALEMPDDSLGLGALFVLWFEACILGGGT